jgi:hypothetical protein
MPVADLPPQLQERVVCSIAAAVKYQIPANIVLAVAEKEAGKPGQWVRNANGTHDVGPMQFNTAYLRDLAGYGITPDDVAAAGCYAFDLAAWRLRQHIRKDRGDLWTRAANYHSGRRSTTRLYRADLVVKAGKVGGLAGVSICDGGRDKGWGAALDTCELGGGAFSPSADGEGERDAGANTSDNGRLEYLRVCPEKTHHRRAAVNNVHEIRRANDGYVLRKRTDPAAWRSASDHNWRLKQAFSTIGTNNCQARIRQPAGTASA